MELSDVEQRDVDVIGRVLGVWQCTERWALAGQTPSPELWAQLLYHDVPLQYVMRADDGACAGIVQLASVNPDHGFGHLELLIDPRHTSDVDKTVQEFVDEVFREHPVRKLLLAAAEDDLDLPPCLAAAVQQVGCLSEHRRRSRDSYASVNIYEIWHEAWASSQRRS